MKTIEFDSSRLGRWDSSLLVYLSAVRSIAATRSIRVDDSGIPMAAKQLLPQEAAPAGLPSQRAMFIERFGLAVIAQWCELVAVTALIGGQLLQTGAALLGRTRMRRSDCQFHRTSAFAPSNSACAAEVCKWLIAGVYAD